MPDTFYMLHTMSQESKCLSTVHSEQGFVFKNFYSTEVIKFKTLGSRGVQGRL